MYRIMVIMDTFFISRAVGCVEMVEKLTITAGQSYFEYNTKSDDDNTRSIVKRNAQSRHPINPDDVRPLSVISTQAEYDRLTSLNDTDVNETVTVDHDFYKVTYKPQMSDEAFNEYWFDVDKYIPDGNKKNGWLGTRKQNSLSHSYRRAVQLDLPFKFPFYGHDVGMITVATGGFVYLGTHMHTWLAAAQYVAPLMANFDTIELNESVIKLAFNASTFVVEWNEVILKNESSLGKFTFQVILSSNGNIQFNYKDIPIAINKISMHDHPRKSGLSDAYLKAMPGDTKDGQPKHVIFEYHRIDISDTRIVDRSVILIHAQPTCISARSCDECHSANVTNFNCSWCMGGNTKYETGFCSDDLGLNRMRQEWEHRQCDRLAKGDYCVSPPITTPAQQTVRPVMRPTPGTTPPPSRPNASTTDSFTESGTAVTSTDSNIQYRPIDEKNESGPDDPIKKAINHRSGITAGGIVGVIFAMCLVMVIGLWVLYAYRNPHSPSGQFLIRYRPTRWRWPTSHSDVRYTASVHM